MRWFSWAMSAALVSLAACKVSLDYEGCRLLYTDGAPPPPAGCVYFDANGNEVPFPPDGGGGGGDGGVSGDGGADADAGNGTDAGTAADAAADAEAEAGTDAGADGGADAAADSGSDAGTGAGDAGDASDAGDAGDAGAGSVFSASLRTYRCTGGSCVNLGSVLGATAIPADDTLRVDSISATDAGVFRIAFHPRRGGAIGEWYDLVADPGATENLASDGTPYLGRAFALVDFFEDSMSASIDSCDPDYSITHVTLLEASAARVRARSVSHSSTALLNGPNCTTGNPPTHDTSFLVQRDYAVFPSGQVFLRTVLSKPGTTPQARFVLGARYRGDWHALYRVDGGVVALDPTYGCDRAPSDWFALYTNSPTRTVALLGAVPSASGTDCDKATTYYTTVFHSFAAFPAEPTWTADNLLLLRPGNLHQDAGAAIHARHLDFAARRVEPTFDAPEGVLRASGSTYSTSVPAGVSYFTPSVRFDGPCSGVTTPSTPTYAFGATDGGCVVQLFPPGEAFPSDASISVTFLP